MYACTEGINSSVQMCIESYTYIIYGVWCSGTRLSLAQIVYEVSASYISKTHDSQ